jgi:hypothetical protein
MRRKLRERKNVFEAVLKHYEGKLVEVKCAFDGYQSYILNPLTRSPYSRGSECDCAWYYGRDLARGDVKVLANEMRLKFRVAKRKEERGG